MSHDASSSFHALIDVHSLIGQSLDAIDDICFSDATLNKVSDERWLGVSFKPEAMPETVRAELHAFVSNQSRELTKTQIGRLWNQMKGKKENIIIFCRERSPLINAMLLLMRGNLNFVGDVASRCFRKNTFLN
jgi:hypothetical protein